MRLAPVILGVCVSLGGYFALSALEPDRYPGRVAHLAETPEQTIALYREALRRDPGSPYRWADLADALYLAGKGPEARRLYDGAIRLAPGIPQIVARAANFHRLAPGIPQIAVRAANFHFLEHRPEEGLRQAARALRMVEAFDAVLFRSFDRLVGNAAAVLREIGGDPRSSIAYTRHLISTSQPDEARVAWQWCRDQGFADDALTSSFLNLLIRERRYAEASQAWTQYLGSHRGDYPSPNLLYNGSFEREPTGAVLDWRIVPSDKFETSLDTSVAKEGRVSLRIRFKGEENVAYSNAGQTVLVTPGKYRFEAWIKTDSITTNEGPQYQIYDPADPGRLNVRVGPFVGSTDWTKAEADITVGSDTHLIHMRVLREPSIKFDNKVSGTVWIDGAKLLRR